MKTKEEINEMPAAELREQVLQTKKDLFSLNLLKGGGLEKPHRIPLLRKQIARLETRLTLLRKKAEDATVAAN
ncbi:MAG: 50S ribosomal protein L29 [Verrucomicrobiota bacterium]|nr:50S ribosomal protein L29 [Verrucomicrobiota bacterium]